MQLTISNNRILELVPGLPDKYNEPLIQGAETSSAKSNLSEISIQTLEGEDYRLQYVIGRFIKQLTGSEVSSPKCLHAVLMLKNSLQQTESTAAANLSCYFFRHCFPKITI